MICLPNQSWLVSIGPGEAAADMPEQLRLEERFWNSTTVHGHEGTVDPNAVKMDELRDDLFANPGFTEN